MKKLFLLLLLIIGVSASPVEAQTFRYGSRNTQPTHRNLSEVVLEDGIYTLTVKYESKTGHRATYTLNVKIQRDVVKCIYFDNGGYIDVNVARSNNQAWLGGGFVWDVDSYGRISGGRAVVTIGSGPTPDQTFTILL